MTFNNSVGIIAANRLPIGKINGFYKNISPESLYQNLIEQQFKKSSFLKKSEIDYVILGNVTNQGGNLARRCALKAGFSTEVPAFTIDHQCGSGLTALITAANYIQSGEASIICTGGVENTSQSNITIDAKSQLPIKRFKMAPEPYEDLDMGIIADITALKYNISRESQDLYALNSHQKANQAIKNKSLMSEVLPYLGENSSIIRDQTVRPHSSLEALAKLSPAFTENGRTTAGNSCPINDGASSLILANSDKPFDFQGYYLGQATIALAPTDFLLAPIKSTEKLLEKFNLKVAEIEAIELNEAFASQALLFQNHFRLDDRKLNSYGGALAFGHPYGATGGILISRLLNRINKLEKPCLGIATLCIAGGMGISILLGNRWFRE
ncbi:acetyl-CoA C-acyltransferase [Lactococcus lactis]|nr:acetyl-CoA C-acyltransferase [Lactococcus lactis]